MRRWLLYSILPLIAVIYRLLTRRSDAGERRNRDPGQQHPVSPGPAAATSGMRTQRPARGRSHAAYVFLALLIPIGVFIAVNTIGDLNAWVAGGTLGLLVLSGAVLLWRLPQWQAESHRGDLSEKEFFEVENSARATLGQLLGAATLIAGLFFAWQQLGSTNQTVYLSEQGQITERFTRAVDQLGSDDLTIRLGGIYALERIARDSERDAGPVMEVLTAYVRGQVPRQTSSPDDLPMTPQSATVSMVPVDVQAVLDVVARRPAIDPQGRCLDLSGTDLSRANLASGNLANLCLRGTDLSEAILGNVNLAGADLTLANLEDAYLDGANLQSANLAKANLSRANLRGADLTGARLDSASLSMAILDGAVLHDAVLVGADLQGAFLFDADFSGAEMADANLTDALISGTLLENARSLTQAQIDSAVGIDDETSLPPGIATPSGRLNQSGAKEGTPLQIYAPMTGATESSSWKSPPMSWPFA